LRDSAGSCSFFASSPERDAAGKGLRDSAGSCSFFASSPERDAAGKKRVIASSLRHSIIAKARPVAISFFYNARKEGGQQSRLNGLRISDGREIKIPFTGTAAE